MTESPEPPVLIPLRNLGSAPLRIEWFGDVSYAGRSGGRSPMVAVTLARGHQGQWIRTDIVDDSPLTASMPIAYLRLLRIGDSTTSVLPAGLPVTEDGGKPTYLLPFSDFDGHRGHTGAFCARVKLPDGALLIVPCMELIRFYFGDSGLLLKRLFSGATGQSLSLRLAQGRVRRGPSHPGARAAFSGCANRRPDCVRPACG